MNETSGVLSPAVHAYLSGAELTPQQIAAIRAYFRQWMMGDFEGEEVEDLREAVDGIETREDITRWLDAAVSCGADPL